MVNAATKGLPRVALVKKGYTVKARCHILCNAQALMLWLDMNDE